MKPEPLLNKYKFLPVKAWNETDQRKGLVYFFQEDIRGAVEWLKQKLVEDSDDDCPFCKCNGELDGCYCKDVACIESLIDRAFSDVNNVEVGYSTKVLQFKTKEGLTFNNISLIAACEGLTNEEFYSMLLSYDYDQFIQYLDEMGIIE